MQDIGTLGGTFVMANSLNNAGDVVGFSFLADERGWHPFLWDGRSMRDLGTLGGGLGYAARIDDAGDIVGASRTSDGAFHGFLWQHGRMQDLPPVAGAASAFASAVNVRGEVVGDQADANGDSLAPVLWRHGHAYDLSTLTAPTDMRLSEAVYIDGQGDIATLGTLPDGRQRLVELVRHRSVPLPGPPVPTQSTAEAHIAATGALRRALRRADRTGDLARALDLRSRRG
jgi:probable HAF family extracellular repeat protein